MTSSECKAKCQMRPVYENLLRTRTSENLGQLGPCNFTELNVFLGRLSRLPQQEFNVENSENKPIVAIGDIHGDLLTLLAVLKLNGLIDVNGNWIVNDVYVVFCGDLIDRYGRCPNTYTPNRREEVDIYEYLLALTEQAAQYNSRIWLLLGNHEIIRVLNYNMYHKYMGNQETGWYGGSARDIFKVGGFMANFYARYCPLVLRIGKYVFLHAGFDIDILENLHRQYPSEDLLTVINHTIIEYLLKPSNVEYSGLFMTRKLVDSQYCLQNIDRIFELLNLPMDGSIIIGHTVQEKGIEYFCDGKVWKIDIAMSDSFDCHRDKYPPLIGNLVFYDDSVHIITEKVEKVEKVDIIPQISRRKRTLQT